MGGGRPVRQETGGREDERAGAHARQDRSLPVQFAQPGQVRLALHQGAGAVTSGMDQQIERRCRGEVVIRDEAEPLGTPHHTRPGPKGQDPHRRRRDVGGPEPQYLPRTGDVEFLGALEEEDADGQGVVVHGAVPAVRPMPP